MVTPRAGPPEQGHGRTDREVELGRPAHDEHVRGSEPCPDLDLGEGVAGQRGDVRQRVVQTAARAADDDHDVGVLGGDLQRELQVGVVLGRRVPLHLGAAGLRLLQLVVGHGVEVTDHEVDVEPEREREGHAGVGTHDAVGRREPVDRCMRPVVVDDDPGDSTVGAVGCA